MVKLKVKVVPGASRTDVAGWLGDELKVRVAVPPEGGKANKAVEALLQDTLGLGSGDVRIVAGESNPHKTVEIAGMTLHQIRSIVASESVR